MKTAEATKEQILTSINHCYDQAWTSNEFIERLNFYGIETYKQNGQVEGIVVEGSKVSLSSLGYTPEVIQSLDPISISEADLDLINEYQTQVEKQEIELKASDIIPDMEQLVREMGVERTDARENELGEIRETGDTKEINEGLER